MALKLLLCVLVVLLPAYEGRLVYALQHVAKALQTLPVAVVTTAQQLVEAVYNGEAQIEITEHLDLTALQAVEQGAIGHLYNGAHLDVSASTLSIRVCPHLLSIITRHLQTRMVHMHRLLCPLYSPHFAGLACP